MDGFFDAESRRDWAAYYAFFHSEMELIRGPGQYMARVRPAGSWSRWSMTGARFPTRRSGFGTDWGSFENCEHAQREALFPPFSLEYTNYSCVKPASSGEKISPCWSYF